MLLDRLNRPLRGVRLVHRPSATPDAAFRVQVVPLRPLTRDEVERVKEHLLDRSGPIVTTALSPAEQQPFLDCGFVPRESLYLLRHNLDKDTNYRTEPARQGNFKIRNARRSDLSTVLEIDRDGFDDFWVFDRQSLNAARRATPTHRYVVATDQRSVVGYAVTGHAGTTSFLQRLGVARSHRRRGVGGQLVVDALRWASSHGARTMLVNTQEINQGARSLYEAHGFVLDDQRLTVLKWEP